MSTPNGAELVSLDQRHNVTSSIVNNGILAFASREDRYSIEVAVSGVQVVKC